VSLVIRDPTLWLVLAQDVDVVKAERCFVLLGLTRHIFMIVHLDQDRICSRICICICISRIRSMRPAADGGLCVHRCIGGTTQPAEASLSLASPQSVHGPNSNMQSM
jgi:hypothetical protein